MSRSRSRMVRIRYNHQASFVEAVQAETQKRPHCRRSSRVCWRRERRASPTRPNPALAPESRFDLGHNAAHALALAALGHCRYRSDNRYVVFQAWPHRLGVPTPIWRVPATCHERRNLAQYAGALDVDERLLADLLDAAQTVTGGRTRVGASGAQVKEGM